MANLGYLLGRAHLEHRAIAEERLAPFALRGKEFGALRIVAEDGPMSQQRLGERMGVDRTTMVAVVDALQREGYVERERDPADRRAYALRVTPRGRRVLPRATAAAEDAEEAFLLRLPPAERDQLRRLLAALMST
ncbi:MAG: MarR family transcriptional regulator [Solirubrobacteraceae bacterium]|nr:MarR family transcriptional regulator [Solirubrobacteraceae bacterium]